MELPTSIVGDKPTFKVTDLPKPKNGFVTWAIKGDEQTTHGQCSESEFILIKEYAAKNEQEAYIVHANDPDENEQAKGKKKQTV